MSIFISIFALAVSAIAYFFPRVAGGPIRWELARNVFPTPPELVHVGYKKARNIEIRIYDGISGTTGLKRKTWYPSDRITIIEAVRTSGKPAPTIEISWRIFLLFRKKCKLSA